MTPPVPVVPLWRCTVCGYIHRDGLPPAECPVCGSASSDFEPYAEAAPPPAVAPSARWRCLNCSYVHTGPQPPAECPVCGAPAERFEALAAAAGAAGAAAGAVRVVIAGAGIAGLSAAETVRQTAPEAVITLLAREAELPYYRLNLTRYLAGEVTAADLPVHPADWYAAQRIDWRGGAELHDVRLAERAVVLQDGAFLNYDKLILAGGAHPFVPPLPGAAREGVTSLRTRADAQRILAAVQAGRACVVIGGGLLGLETAGALARRGADVTLLEGHEWLMPRQLNRAAGELLMTYVVRAGIRLRTRAGVAELLGDERVAGVQLKDGVVLPAGLVILAAGVRPNSAVARRAGLEVNQGVVVNNRLFTSHPDVLAAGDVAEHRGVLYGAWGPAQYQGSIAGLNAAGAPAEFGGIPRANALKVLGIDVMSMGRFEPEDASFSVIEQEWDGRYARFVFRDGQLAGAVLVGDTSLGPVLKKAIETRQDCSGLLGRRPGAPDVAEHFRGV